MRVVARLRDARVLVPVKGVTSHSRGVTQRGMSDGQVQGDHRVTTSGIDEGVGVVARLRDVGVLVPCEGILRRSGGVARATMVDGQVQGHHAVAAVRVRECVRQVVATGSDVSMLVPVE